MIMNILTLFLFFLALSSKVYCSDEECKPERAICEYWWVVEEVLTMRYGNDLVYGYDGKLIKYNEHPPNFTFIPVSKVITADGVPRMVTTVNKTIPGPPIIVYENQEVKIHVKNNLLDRSTSIHWHGLEQRGTPWMDGVGYITQCPITAGQTFTYKFKAANKGTYWYHSHMGAQRTNGVFGAFIIKERPTQNISPPEGVIMVVGDWQHDQSSEVYLKMNYGFFIDNKPAYGGKTIDGGFYDIPWFSALINGRGRYTNPKSGAQLQVPLAQFNVTQGRKYRFRVINGGTEFPLRISVDHHNLTLAASDGYDLKEKIVESIVINPGERYDFFLDANQPIGNYWVRADSLEVDVKNHSAEAILHYYGATEMEPTTSRRKCTEQNPCYVVNCPYRYYPNGTNTSCLAINDLEAKADKAPPTYSSGTSEEHFLNFGFPGPKGNQPASINGRQFEFNYNFPWWLSNQTKICSNKKCGFDKICKCNHNLKLEYNKTIQMVFTNMGNGTGWSHPIHMHGHTFYVLKMGFSVTDQTTARNVRQNPDINCGGGLNFCNNASWSNKTWADGNIPGLNLKNPPRKDTIIVPTGGYVVLRIRSDNPGRWFMHCHIEVHQIDGMAMFIDEAPDKQSSLPKGFPQCKSFNIEGHQHNGTTKREQRGKDTAEDLSTKFLVSVIVGSVLGITVVVLIIVIIQIRRTKSTATSPTVTYNRGSEQLGQGRAQVEL